MDTKKINDLDFIKQMMNESQGLFHQSSSYFIVWGITLPIATLIQMFLLQNEMHKYNTLNWIIMQAISIGISIYIGSRSENSHKTTITKLFGVVGLTLFLGYLISFVGMMAGLIPTFIALAFIGIFLGAMYLIWGTLQKSRVLQGSGVIWYILSILFLIIKDDYIVSNIMGFSPIFFCLIPALILRKQNG